MASSSVSNSNYNNKSTEEWSDGRFERAVDILQSLPRSGPIQTSYDSKLLLYSLYKQATEGDIQSPRPGLLDVMGRAKWDAWNKRRGVSEDLAKRLYVDSLIKILRTFMDRPQAVAHIRDLETFTFQSGGTAGSQTHNDYDSDQSSFEGDPLPTSQIRPAYLNHNQEDVAARTSRSRRVSTSINRRSPITAPESQPLTLHPAPSLPGYGPPRTGADSVLGDADYRSESEGESLVYSIDEENSRVRLDATFSIHPERFSTPNSQHQIQTTGTDSRILRPKYASHSPSSSSVLLQQSSVLPLTNSLHPTQSQSYLQPFPGFSPSPYPPPSHSVRSGPSPGVPSQIALHYPIGMNLNRETVSPPVAVTAALDRIQTSLSALHERLEELESNHDTESSAATLVKLAFYQLLVFLQLRSPSKNSVLRSEKGISRLAVKIFKALLSIGRRILGDFAILLLILALLTKFKRGEKDRFLLRSLYLISEAIGGKKKDIGHVIT